MSRQHQRVLIYLFVGTLVFCAYYLYYGRPIDPLAVPFHAHAAWMNDAPQRLRSNQSYDWRKAPFFNEIESYIPLPTGKPRALPPIQSKHFPETPPQKEERERRRIFVRQEFKRVWESYRLFAWAKDELKPVTGGSEESFGGWGATLVDSLDTLWIMGLKEEFHEAVEAVAAIDFGNTTLQTINVFETTIRYLGGMLSAYDLSHEPVLLEKAVQVGEMLYRAFDTTNHTPLALLLVTNAKLSHREKFAAVSHLCFACLGSLAMEFTHLAQATSEPKYYDAVARISFLIAREQSNTRLPGLWPVYSDPANEQFNQSNIFSIGANADSTYEYFPKMYALLGGLDPLYEKLYTDAATMIEKHMLFRPMVPDTHHGENLLMCGDVAALGDFIELYPNGQHLTCFIGGMFALAGRLFDKSSHIDLGAKLTQGCIYAYAAMPSGIMPEAFRMFPCASRTSCPWDQAAWESSYMFHHYPSTINTDPEDDIPNIPGFTYITDKRYLLRPEAIESVFILYRITGRRQYQDDAWNMFTSIVAASRTQFANGQVRDVTRGAGASSSSSRWANGANATNVEDKMESFWTAETLKYFYLVFSAPDMLSLDDWVFNTEAHPFRRPRA